MYFPATGIVISLSRLTVERDYCTLNILCFYGTTGTLYDRYEVPYNAVLSNDFWARENDNKLQTVITLYMRNVTEKIHYKNVNSKNKYGIIEKSLGFKNYII